MRRYFNNGILLLSYALILILIVNTVCCISVKAQTYPEEHIAYCESDRYGEDITGYFGVLADIHEYTKDDSSMLKYSIVDDLKKMITFDWGNLTGREEYEVLLAEIMMNDASLSGLDDLYKKNLKNSTIEVAKYINNQFTDLAVDKAVQEPTKKIQELIVKMEELPYNSVEFSKSYEEYKEIVIKTTDLKKAKRFSSYLGTAITAGNSIYESSENLLTTIEYGEAYKNVSDEFVTVLTKFRDKLNDKDSVKEIKKNYNISDPFFVDAMTKATNDFVDKMEHYKDEGALKIGKRAATEAGGKLLFDVGADKCSDFVRAVFPLVNGTLIISEAGQLVMDINPNTDFDRIAYSGNMFARLYYIEVYLKELLNDLSNDLKSNMDEKSAYLFDEGISIYKSIESSAEKYASIYVQKKIEEYSNTISEKENSWLPWDRSKLKKAQKDLDLFTDYQKQLADAKRKTEAISCHSSNSSQEEFGSETGEYIITPFLSIIDNLVSRYGSLRIVQNNGEWQNEANGLCYLNLIDFTGDGNDELFTVCKNEDEDHYTGYIYTLNNGKAELIYENPEIEYNTRYEYDIVYLGYTKDTGFIFGTGWDAPDIDDRTFYWYKDGDFEPVYRSKGYYDDGLEEKVIEEELKIVDIFDDEHIDELWDSFPRVTLRTMGDEDENGDLFTSYNLQKIIDDTIRKTGADLKDLPSSITFSEEKLNEISLAAIFHCMEKNLNEWTPDYKDVETFWDLMSFYCSFTNWISSVDYPRAGEYEEYRVIPNNLLKNASFAFYKDFNGYLPEINDDIWRAQYYDDQSTAITIGDNAPIIIINEKYQKNDDGTIDAEYVTEYSGNIPAGTYKVHFEPNSHYNEVNADATYYYRVSSVERIGKASVLEDSNSNNSSTEQYQEVINEYRSAYNDFELYQEDSSAFMEKYPLVNVNALIEPYLSSMDPTFFSAIKDINEDGVDELIIGVDVEHPNSIYTFYGGQIIPLINDIGERSYINIYDDGTIYRHDSGGASFSIDTIYEINESGDGLSTIKQFEADWDRDPDYPYYDGAESLSQEQFNAEYLDKNEMEFNWSE